VALAVRIASSLHQDEKYIRFPMVPLLNTPLEYRGLQQLTVTTASWGRLKPRIPIRSLTWTFRHPDNLCGRGKPRLLME
jgi:hypothetical protein